MQQELKNHSVVFLGAHGQGKSTISGLIVSELNHASPYALERIDEHPHVQEKPDLRYTFLMDRLRQERNNKQTQIFSTNHVTIKQKMYTLINIPGQHQYINQMQIGIAYGDIVVFVLSAVNDKYQQSFQLDTTFELQFHLCIAMEKKHFICVINDMDLVEYQQFCYQYVVDDFSKRLEKFQINTKNIQFIPISLKQAENIQKKIQNMNWYKGPTLIEALDQIPNDDEQHLIKKPLRINIYDCIRIPGIGTVALGKLLYGQLKPNQYLRFAPIPFQSLVKAIETHHFYLDLAIPGNLIGFNLANLQYKEIKNGYLCSNFEQDPVQECSSFIVQLKILDDVKQQFKVKQYYTLHFFTIRMQCCIEEISQKVSTKNQNIENSKILEAGDTALVQFRPIKQLTVEKYIDYPDLGKIAIVDNRRMIAFGQIVEVTKKALNQQI
ncbi:unnamed protein product [Paramecium sonneborni]|uniref:Tr-type G domain-containing protein n=1 Tax=Paramecium sonneborni TaxID=65129 RepID=A0A8S1LRJ8_9CILI|nr:unnamed protein product [Paramecium sonneborni]